ncbi:MAG: TIGR03013 family XrtA/PEP-CTERM system glycosyltransferase [Telluria sp.]
MIRIFNHYVSRMALVLLLMELGILLSAAVLAGTLSGPRHARVDGMYLTSVAFALVVLFSMSALGMYQHTLRAGVRATLVRLLPAFALGFGLMRALIALRPDMYVGRASIGLVFLIGAGGVALTRLIVLKSASTRLLERRLLFVGSGAAARECLELARKALGPHRGCVAGCVAVGTEETCVSEGELLPAAANLLQLARSLAVSEIVVTVPDRRGAAGLNQQLLECALRGVHVIDAATFFEREACQIRVDSLQPSYLIFGGGFDQGFVRAASKRLFDVAASVLVALLALPVVCVAALAIRLEDGGPVFYAQERVGKDGKIFRVLKLRSMRTDAESGGLPSWAAQDDPRVTRVGRIIRLLRIDELPQMINVLRGEMSFVGPRPERAYFVEQLAREVPYYEIRHRIKPGVTGLAQVRYQYGASVGDAVEKLQYDLYYVKNNSLFLDLLILIDTVQVVMTGKGSR